MTARCASRVRITQRPSARRVHVARLICLPVARLHGAGEIRCRRPTRNPVRRFGADLVRQQQRMVVILDDDEHVTREILGRDIPGLLAGAAHAADLEALPLAQRVVHQAAVRADHATFGRLDAAALGGQVLREELGERPLADEADARAVALVVHGQRAFVRDVSDLALRQVADREQGLCEHRARHGVQEVGLVLVAIDAAQQARAVRVESGARVMTRREPVGAQPLRVLETDAELDLAVARDVGVGRAARREFVEEMAEDAVAVVRREVHGVQRDLQLVADLARVLQVRRGRAVVVVVAFPVAHEQAVHVVARVLQERGRHGGIDAAGDREHDAGAGHPRIIGFFTSPACGRGRAQRG